MILVITLTNNMANITAKELGKFEPIYIKLLEKFKLEPKSSEILLILLDAVRGKIDSYVMANLFSEKLGIDLLVASNLAFRLKEKILDKKSQLEDIKENIQEEIESGFNPDVLGQELLGKVGIKLTDSVLRNRYNDAILSWLRDVRKDTDLKEVLTRSTKIGGVGMDEDTFDRLQELLNVKKKQIQEEKINLPEIVKAYEDKQGLNTQIVTEQEIDVAAKVKGPVAQIKEAQDVHIGELLQEKGISYDELAQKETIKRQLGDRERVSEVPDIAEEIIEEEKFLEGRKEIEPPPLPIPPPSPAPVKRVEPVWPKAGLKPPVIRRTETQNRPKMEDVRMESSVKLYGPIDELGALSIMDFRRLSKDPKEATLKIIGKLDLLEDESLVKKMQGIKALRSSPLYKTYAEIMNQAMIAGKSIEQVVTEKNAITLPEYKAIMELNQILKY